jgi:lipopolysaccharide/colanic/teichoic acid biosynthesis glycosyltransferase
MAKNNNVLQRIESHEKLCRIMQKLTHKKIHSIEERVKRLEKILLTCTGALITGMLFLIYTLVSQLTF